MKWGKTIINSPAHLLKNAQGLGFPISPNKLDILRPMLVFTPEAAGDLTGHGGDSFLVPFCHGHTFACKHPVEDQVLYLMRDQFMSHRRKVQFAQVNIPKKPLSLLAYFRCDVIGVALVPAFESGWAIGNIDVEPLAIVVKMDAECWFYQFLVPLGYEIMPIINPMPAQRIIF